MAYSLLIIFCAILPFQFALNPTEGIDLAIARIFSLGIFFLWFIASLKNKILVIPKTSLLLPFFSFLFLALFSSVFAENFSWSFRKIGFLFSFLPLFFVVASYAQETAQKKIIRALLWGGWILAISAIIQFSLQFFLGIEKSLAVWEKISLFFLGNTFSQSVFEHQSWLVHAGGKDFFRAISIFPDPHMLSYYLEMLLPFSLLTTIKESDLRKKILLCILSFILFTALILTFSRGAYIGIIAGVISALIIYRKNISERIKLPAIIIGLAFLLALFFTNNPIQNRLLSSFDTSEGSNLGRFSMWKEAALTIEKHPLLGTGIGNFPLAVLPSATYRDPIYAHNLYLDIAAELGLPALIMFVILLIIAIQGYNKKGSYDHFWTAGAISLIIFSVHSLFDTPLYSVHILPLFLIIIAISNSHAND